MSATATQPERMNKTTIYWLSRTATVLILGLSTATYFWIPEGAVQWTADILLRTYLMFLGTVMAHECTHGLLGRTKKANFWWGRLGLIPCTVPYINFRKTHLMHHAHTNDPVLDPDYWVKPNHWWEVPFRALSVPHNWIVWLTRHGKISRRDVNEWVIHYIFIFAFYISIGMMVGVERAAWGLFVPLVLVSHLLWYPFAYYTHHGHSQGDSEYRSHNYYGLIMYWATLGLSMHRVHHEHPRLAWIEMLPFVERNPGGFMAGIRMDRRFEPASDQAAYVADERPSLAALDLISAKLHQDTRPLDFSAILELKLGPDLLDRLKAGAASACRLYPTSASRVDGRRWAWSGAVPFESVALEDGQSVDSVVHAFVNGDMNPHGGPQVRQQLLLGGERPVLLTRFHHCAFDGVSASMWLFHQLMVAGGQAEAEFERGSWSPPALSHHDDPHRKSKYSHWGGARRLWTENRRPSAERKCISMQLDSAPIRTAIDGHGRITYNDFLAAHFTQALVEWNAQHGAGTTQIGLWLPTNIRPLPFVGFGNGSSRMRVYADSMAGPSVLERCQQFREQVGWSRKNGEWYVPPAEGLKKLPDSWLAPFLRGFLGRPGVDMGTAPFTHLERIGMMDRFVPMIHSARWVMMLHKWHPLGMAAATLGEHTDMTLTYDPAQLSDASAEEFMALYKGLLDAGLAELST